jgi:hypothetical protein
MMTERTVSKREPLKDLPWDTDDMSNRVHRFFDSLFEHQNDGYKDISHFSLFEQGFNCFFINFPFSKTGIDNLKNQDILKLDKDFENPSGSIYIFNPENNLLNQLELEGKLITIKDGETDKNQVYLSFYSVQV